MLCNVIHVCITAFCFSCIVLFNWLHNKSSSFIHCNEQRRYGYSSGYNKIKNSTNQEKCICFKQFGAVEFKKSLNVFENKNFTTPDNDANRCGKLKRRHDVNSRGCGKSREFFCNSIGSHSGWN